MVRTGLQTYGLWTSPDYRVVALLKNQGFPLWHWLNCMLYINSSVHEFAYKIKQVWIKTLPNLKDHKKTRSKYFQFWFMFWRHFFTLIYLHLWINDPQPYHTPTSHTLQIFVYNMLSSRHFNIIRTLTTWSFPKNFRKIQFFRRPYRAYIQRNYRHPAMIIIYDKLKPIKKIFLGTLRHSHTKIFHFFPSE